MKKGRKTDVSQQRDIDYLMHVCKTLSDVVMKDATLVEGIAVCAIINYWFSVGSIIFNHSTKQRHTCVQLGQSAFEKQESLSFITFYHLHWVMGASLLGVQCPANDFDTYFWHKRATDIGRKLWESISYIWYWYYYY